MSNNSGKTIRLLYPQWQGGVITHWITEVENPDDRDRGYTLGSRLLDAIAPATDNPVYTVPVESEIRERLVQDGVTDRDIIARQSRAALDILNVVEPFRILTLGGECSTSVVPFTYLASKYGDDVAVIWMDAHPDITLPGDEYTGYHAMAVTALMGKGDSKILDMMPARIAPSQIFFAGLCDWELDEIRNRQKEYGMDYASPESLNENSNPVINWLRNCGSSKVMIHFDIDVLDPNDILIAVGNTGKMTMEAAIRLINDIAAEKELVALTVAEPMPRNAIRLRNMLRRLPLMK